MNRMKLLALAGALFTAGAAYTVTAATTTVSRTNEPTTPLLADFNSQFANHPNKTGYNTNVPDRMFLDSLSVKCAAPQRITSAQFTIDVVKLTQGANRGDNDGLAFWNNPTSLFSAHMWTAAETPNTAKQLTYNLGALPGLGAGQLGSNVLINSIPSASMLSSMQTNGRFSFSVQDDTMVRRATLTYTCEGGRVASEASGLGVSPTAVTSAVVANAGAAGSAETDGSPAHKAGIGNLVYGLTKSTMTGGPCGPYRICFNVNVPPKVLWNNGSGKIVIEVMQNGLPVHTVLSPTITSDGDFCIDIPQNAPYLNPNLGGFDVHAAGQFFSGSLPLPPKVAGIRPFGVTLGLNNDIAHTPNATECRVVDGGGGGGSTCCPKYLEINKLTPMFKDMGGTDGTAQTEMFQHASPAHAALVTAINAHLALLKVSGCPNAAAIRLTFTKYNTNSTTFPTALPNPISPTWTNTGSTFSVIYNGTSFSGTGSFPMANDPNYMAFVATATLLNQQGQPTTCSEFNPDCFKVLRTATINYANAFRVAAPAGGGQPAQQLKRADF